MLLASVVLTSCLGDNDSEGDVYSDTAITAVTLGTLNRYTMTTSSKTGNDTIIKTSLTGSNYKITIDQLGQRIFNTDSLPLGTDLKHVTISTLTTKNGGVAFIRSLISDTLFYVSSTDSLDFTQPRTIRVMSSNGESYRDYTMTLSASTMKGTTFGWQRIGQSDELAGWTDKKLVLFRDTVYLMDKDIAIVDNDRGATALRVNDAGAIEAQDFFTADGWKPLDGNVENPGLATLIGSTQHEIFAIGKDGRLKVSFDGMGRHWQDEQLDDSPSLLPTTGIAMAIWKYAPADSTDFILLAGNSDAEIAHAICWRKLSRYHATGMATEGIWVYMPVDGYNRYTLPRQEYLSITYLNDILLAVGSDMTLYQSRDQGITWKKASVYTLPSQITGSRVVIGADSLDRLWLLTDSGELWMGTLR